LKVARANVLLPFRPAAGRPTRWELSTEAASIRRRASFRERRATSSARSSSERRRRDPTTRRSRSSTWSSSSSRFVLISLVASRIIRRFQLYNEEIIDLLAANRTEGLKISEDHKTGEIYIKNVTSIPVDSAKQILDALKKGSRHRTTAATKMNETSSRSHAIFTVLIKQQRMVPMEVGSCVEVELN